jgi:hypothetical protein
MGSGPGGVICHLARPWQETNPFSRKDLTSNIATLPTEHTPAGHPADRPPRPPPGETPNVLTCSPAHEAPNSPRNLPATQPPHGTTPQVTHPAVPQESPTRQNRRPAPPSTGENFQGCQSANGPTAQRAKAYLAREAYRPQVTCSPSNLLRWIEGAFSPALQLEWTIGPAPAGVLVRKRWFFSPALSPNASCVRIYL